MFSKISTFCGPLSPFSTGITPIPLPTNLLFLDSGTASSFKLNGGSIRFFGSSHLVTVDDDFKLGTTDFTVELWFYKSSEGSMDQMGLISNYYTPNNIGFTVYISSGGILTAFMNAGMDSAVIEHPTPITQDEWHHLAYVRQGTDLSLFLDGSQFTVSAPIMNLNDPNNATLNIGKTFVNINNQKFVGFITNVRITHDVVYNDAFIPPISQLTSNGNTKLLLLAVDPTSTFSDFNTDQSQKTVTNFNTSWYSDTPILVANRVPKYWSDLSANSNNFRFYTQSQFTEEFGKSIYITGGNFATGPSLGNLEKFTVDTWVNFKTLGDYAQVVTEIWNGSGDINYMLGFHEGEIRAGFFKYGTGFIRPTGFTPSTDTWYNFTVTYDKQNVNFFVNGETFSSVSTMFNLTSSDLGSIVGKKWDDSNTIDGYVSIVKIWDGPLTYSTISENYLNLQDRFHFNLHLSQFYTFDASGSNIYELRSGLVGTISGTVGYSADNGGILIFGETSSINFGNPNSLNQNGDLSVFAWVKFDGFNTAYNIILDHYGSAPSDIFFTVKPNLDYTYWYMNIYTQNNFGVPGNEYGGLYDTTPINLNRWYHLGFTLKNGGDLTFYVDGVLSSTFSNVSRIRTSNDVIIGSSAINNGLRGSLGELRLYTRILTPQEILNHYDSTKTNYYLLMHLDANDLASYNGGSTWYDLTGKGWDVELYNSPSFESGSIYFDRALSQYGQLGDFGQLKKFTVDTWFKLKSLPSNGTFPQIITNIFQPPVGVFINFAMGLINGVNANGWDGKFMGGYFANNPYYWINTDGFLPEVDTWYNLLLTYNGNSLNLYLDGNTYSTISSNVEPKTSGLGYLIGRRWDYPEYIDGNISVVRVWSDALPYDEILNEYNEIRQRFYGSLKFGTPNTWLTIPSSPDFNFATGSFTVEWWQNSTTFDYDPNYSNPRIYTIGFGTQTTLQSFFLGNYYVVPQIYTRFIGNFDYTSPCLTATGSWVHYAVTRDDLSTVRIFENGLVIASQSNVTFDVVEDDLYIGGDPYYPSFTMYQGYISNFHMVKGYAKYTTNFTPSDSIISPTYGTVLLLNNLVGSEFVDYTGKTVLINGGVTWSNLNPFS